jgi:hypothetical protein
LFALQAANTAPATIPRHRAALQGQGGVSKATVSVVFNNDDPRQSPAGYEHCETITVTRTIVIGGRNKYLINGHAVQANTVQDFFHSVQLNVNNPHFLIMQVREGGDAARLPPGEDAACLPASLGACCCGASMQA